LSGFKSVRNANIEPSYTEQSRRKAQKIRDSIVNSSIISFNKSMKSSQQMRQIARASIRTQDISGLVDI